jgi:hypothetical protein
MSMVYLRNLLWIYNNRINILLKIIYKIICSLLFLVLYTFIVRILSCQSEIVREKTTAIRLFEMVQKVLQLFSYNYLCLLLCSIMAFFKFYFEIVQVKKFNYSLMVGANHKVMNFDKKCHIFAALFIIEARWDLSFAERFIRCPILNYL